MKMAPQVPAEPQQKPRFSLVSVTCKRVSHVSRVCVCVCLFVCLFVQVNMYDLKCCQSLEGDRIETLYVCMNVRVACTYVSMYVRICVH